MRREDHEHAVKVLKAEIKRLNTILAQKPERDAPTIYWTSGTRFAYIASGGQVYRFDREQWERFMHHRRQGDMVHPSDYGQDMGQLIDESAIDEGYAIRALER